MLYIDHHVVDSCSAIDISCAKSVDQRQKFFILYVGIKFVDVLIQKHPILMYQHSSSRDSKHDRQVAFDDFTSSDNATFKDAGNLNESLTQLLTKLRDLSLKKGICVTKEETQRTCTAYTRIFSGQYIYYRPCHVKVTNNSSTCWIHQNRSTINWERLQGYKSCTNTISESKFLRSIQNLDTVIQNTYQKNWTNNSETLKLLMRAVSTLNIYQTDHVQNTGIVHLKEQEILDLKAQLLAVVANTSLEDRIRESIACIGWEKPQKFTYSRHQVKLFEMHRFDKKRSLVIWPTGSGKTYYIIWSIMCALKQNESKQDMHVLYVVGGNQDVNRVSYLIHMHQTMRDLVDESITLTRNQKNHTILVQQGTQQMFIHVATYASRSMLKENKNFQYVFLDEVHKLSKNNIKFLKSLIIDQNTDILSFTATPTFELKALNNAFKLPIWYNVYVIDKSYETFLKLFKNMHTSVQDSKKIRYNIGELQPNNPNKKYIIQVQWSQSYDNVQNSTHISEYTKLLATDYTSPTLMYYKSKHKQEDSSDRKRGNKRILTSLPVPSPKRTKVMKEIRETFKEHFSTWDIYKNISVRNIIHAQSNLLVVNDGTGYNAPEFYNTITFDSLPKNSDKIQFMGRVLRQNGVTAPDEKKTEHTFIYNSNYKHISDIWVPENPRYLIQTKTLFQLIE